MNTIEFQLYQLKGNSAYRSAGAYTMQQRLSFYPVLYTLEYHVKFSTIKNPVRDAAFRQNLWALIITPIIILNNQYYYN